MDLPKMPRLQPVSRLRFPATDHAEANPLKHVLGVMSAAREKLPTSLPIGKKWFYTIALGGFVLLTVAGAKVSIPLPGTPVPATLQTLAALLAGLLLGSRLGALSQAAYLALGLAGLPVFALPGGGPAYLLGPTGGYLLGSIAAAAIAGAVAPPVAGTGFGRRLAAVTAGVAALHAAGVLWLAFFFLPDTFDAFRAGSLPFIVFDLAKGMVACGAAGAGTAIAGSAFWTSRSAD
jgi:biotin transport system substrate-specific component